MKCPLVSWRVSKLYETYPERYIVDFHSFSQKVISKSKLLESLDGFWLHSISLARRCFVWPVIQYSSFDSISD